MPKAREPNMLVDDRGAEFRITRQASTTESSGNFTKGRLLSWIRRSIVVLFLLVIGARLLWLVYRMSQTDTKVMTTTVLIVVAMLLACAGVYWCIRTFRRHWSRRLDVLVQSSRRQVGVCGACGSPLSGVPVDPDGCKTCPQCSHAWRSHMPTPAS